MHSYNAQRMIVHSLSIVLLCIASYSRLQRYAFFLIYTTYARILISPQVQQASAKLAKIIEKTINRRHKIQFAGSTSKCKVSENNRKNNQPAS